MGHAARAMVERHEASLAPGVRRRLGSHYTPAPLAARLVEVAIEELGGVPQRVCDPSCGAGAFLLAAADAMVARGVPPEEVVRHRLAGADVDPATVEVARDAVRCWAVEQGVDPPGPDPAVVVADALGGVPPGWASRFDLVVGNPPFLAQRTSDTARDEAQRDAMLQRFGDVGAYTDTSALFLLCALDLLAPDGVAVMIQPQSVLSARDAGGVRRRLMEGATLAGLWGSSERHFEAEVDVCAPVLRRRRAAAGEAVVLRWGSRAEVVGAGPQPEGRSSWGPLLAACLGVPAVPAPDPEARLVDDVATTTAGFRDEFYALAAAAREPGQAGWSARSPRLVTVGMIDAGRLTWGARARRLGGRSVLAPRLDRHALHRDAPRVASWAANRLRPKVLVATQTRIVEAVADPSGDCVPVTPTISVEPVGGGGRGSMPDVWALTAALLAPPVAARAVATNLGSGLSLGSIRWSARAVRAVPLPTGIDDWATGASLVRRLADAPDADVAGLLDRLGPAMARAHGLDPDHPVVSWWRERALPA